MNISRNSDGYTPQITRSQWIGKQEMEIEWTTIQDLSNLTDTRFSYTIEARPVSLSNEETVITKISGPHSSFILDNINSSVAYQLTVTTEISATGEMHSSHNVTVKTANPKEFDSLPHIVASQNGVIFNCSITNFMCEPEEYTDNEELVASLASNVRGQTIYSVDKAGAVFERSFLRNVKRISKISQEKGNFFRLAYDWLNHFLYIATSRELKRWEGSGNEVRRIWAYPDNYIMFDVCVDPIRGYLFILYKIKEENTFFFHLEKLELPPSNIMDISYMPRSISMYNFSSDIANPSFTLDYDNEYIYLLQKTSIKQLSYDNIIKVGAHNFAVGTDEPVKYSSQILRHLRGFYIRLDDRIRVLEELIGSSDKSVQLSYNKFPYLVDAIALFTLSSQPWPKAPNRVSNIQSFLGYDGGIVEWSEISKSKASSSTAWDRWLYTVTVIEDETKDKAFPPLTSQRFSVTGSLTLRLNMLSPNQCYIITIATGAGLDTSVRSCTTKYDALKIGFAENNKISLQVFKNGMAVSTNYIQHSFNSPLKEIRSYNGSFWALSSDSGAFYLSSNNTTWDRIRKVIADGIEIEQYTDTLYFIDKTKWIYKTSGLSDNLMNPTTLYTTNALDIAVESSKARLFWSAGSKLFQGYLLVDYGSERCIYESPFGDITSIALDTNADSDDNTTVIYFTRMLDNDDKQVAELFKLKVPYSNDLIEIKPQQVGTLKPFTRTSQMYALGDLIVWNDVSGILQQNMNGNSSAYIRKTQGMIAFHVFPKIVPPLRWVVPAPVLAQSLRLSTSSNPLTLQDQYQVMNWRQFYLHWDSGTKQNQPSAHLIYFRVTIVYQPFNEIINTKYPEVTQNRWLELRDIAPETNMQISILAFTNWTKAIETHVNLSSPARVPKPAKISSFYHQVVQDPRSFERFIVEGKLCWASGQFVPGYPITSYRIEMNSQKLFNVLPSQDCQVVSMSIQKDTLREMCVTLFSCRKNVCSLPDKRCVSITTDLLKSEVQVLNGNIKIENDTVIFKSGENSSMTRKIYETQRGLKLENVHFDWIANQIFFFEMNAENDNKDKFSSWTLVQLSLSESAQNGPNMSQIWVKEMSDAEKESLTVLSVDRILLWQRDYLSSLSISPSTTYQSYIAPALFRSTAPTRSSIPVTLSAIHLDLGPAWSSLSSDIVACNNLIGRDANKAKCSIVFPTRGFNKAVEDQSVDVFVNYDEYKMIGFSSDQNFCRIYEFKINQEIYPTYFPISPSSLQQKCSAFLVSDANPPLIMWVSLTPHSSASQSTWFKVPGKSTRYRSPVFALPGQSKNCFEGLADFKLYTCLQQEALLSWTAPNNTDITRHTFRYRKVTDSPSKWISLMATIDPVEPNRLYSVEIAGLDEGQVYEFGLKTVDSNSNFSELPPKDSTGPQCTCMTAPGKPEPPTQLQYKYLQGRKFELMWTPGSSNGADITLYLISTKSLTLKNDTELSSNTSDKVFTPVGQSRMAIPLENKAVKDSDWTPVANTTQPVSSIYIERDVPQLIRVQAVNEFGTSIPSEELKINPIGIDEIKAQQTMVSPAISRLSLSKPIIYSLFSGLIVLLIALLVIFIYMKKRNSRFRNNKRFLMGLTGPGETAGLEMQALAPLWSQEVNSLYGADPPDLDSIDCLPHIPSSHIRFLRYIGCGAFGKVWEGWLKVADSRERRYEKVALKVRNTKALSEEEFKQEAVLMHKYQHPNIVRLIGVSFDSPTQQCLVLEIMELGNLREYLHKARPRLTRQQGAPGGHSRTGFSTATIERSAGGAGGGNSESAFSPLPPESPTPSLMGAKYEAALDIPSLMHIIRDIVSGCKYLEDKHFVHRDIAARNCLVSQRHTSGRTVKLSDFGLARDIYKNDYYRKQNEPKLPVRWMSPEAIRDGLFTNKSDVWSFAVTCWEVMTLGADPYYGNLNTEVMNLVLDGQVLEKPENCPQELYEAMLQCWNQFPEMRPSFADVAERIDTFFNMTKNPMSAFSKPFVQCFPLDPSVRNAAGMYEGNISNPTTEQTVLTSGDVGCTLPGRNMDNSHPITANSGPNPSFFFTDGNSTHSSLASGQVPQYLKLSLAAGPLYEGSEESSPGNSSMTTGPIENRTPSSHSPINLTSTFATSVSVQGNRDTSRGRTPSVLSSSEEGTGLLASQHLYYNQNSVERHNNCYDWRGVAPEDDYQTPKS